MTNSSSDPRLPPVGDGQNSLAGHKMRFEDYHIVAIVPAYNEEDHIETVLSSLPAYLRTVIVIDDASSDRTGEIIRQRAKVDQRIHVIQHRKNQGVGGSVVTGLKKALEQDAQIVVKIDGDGQMPMDELPRLLTPLILAEADYTKGNRFRDVRALGQMPVLRRVGNMALSFLVKAAVGYWDCFDPCNGFVAIRGEVLRQLPLENIGRSYYFEISMLSRLYLLGAVVRDVPMAARYGTETSHLPLAKTAIEFPSRLLVNLCRRLWLKNFIYDFSMESVFMLSGIPLCLVGLLYGGLNWIHYGFSREVAPTGTVVIPAMLIILGFQLLLSAIGEDLRSIPQRPFCVKRLSKCSLSNVSSKAKQSFQS